MESVFIIYFGVGFLFVGISLPLIKRKVKPNNWYGVRLPQTMNNEKIWYEVNEISGRHLCIFGLAICLLTIILYFSQFFSFNLSFGIMTLLILAGTISIVILAMRVTNKLSKKK